MASSIKKKNRRDVLSCNVIVPSKSVKNMNLGFDFIAGSSPCSDPILTGSDFGARWKA